MPRLDPFTRKRLEKFISDFRSNEGVLPTLTDLDINGFDSERIKDALHDGIIVEFYVTLTNGVIRKGYKIKEN